MQRAVAAASRAHNDTKSTLVALQAELAAMSERDERCHTLPVSSAVHFCSHTQHTAAYNAAHVTFVAA